jgi:ADP-heptose:LPS heptosyltransferase
LVISVDSAWVHWAGAIGKPVWALLASEAQSDWRWMTGRDDSPWYPSARLFRQSSFGDWPSAIARAAQALAALDSR